MTLLTTYPSVTDDDGTGQTGTPFNNAYNAAAKAAIEALVHSTTNPTETPKATTDEVVAARGSKSSLDARLDVSLNDDGTLKEQASLATAAQLKSALGSRNIALNGDFFTWTAGGAAAPDNWTLTGAAATIARCGDGQADTFTFGAGRYSAKITRAGTDAKLTQARIAAADFAYYANCKSQKVSVCVKVKTSIASHARITVDDGATTTSSSYHTGGGSEEHLTVTHTISGSATKLDVYCEVKNSNGDAYFGGIMIVFADLVPTDWSPLSAIDDASATAAGIISLGTQDIPGAKTFKEPPKMEPGGSATAIPISSGHTTKHTDVGNVGAGEDDLMSETIAANALSVDGQAIRVTAWGIFAANANSKTIKFKFGAASMTIPPASGYNSGFWWIDVIVQRTGAATQIINGFARVSITASVYGATEVAGAETLSGAITLKFTGEATDNNDIVQKGLVVEYLG